MDATVLEQARALAEEIAALLTARGETLAVAECTSGGLIADLLTDVPGCSRWFIGSVVPYGGIAKERLLDLRPDLLAREGSVSEAVALALADGARRRLETTWGLGETGIAGPQASRRSTKAVGESCVAVAGGTPAGPVAVFRAVRCPDRGRRANKCCFAVAALELLVETLRTE